MRTPEETAKYMIERYGKDAGIHCIYAVMNNDGFPAASYWREVRDTIQRLEKQGKKDQ